MRAARELVARRGRREPLAYVLGDWDFRRLTLKTDARALVPRPETEVVVERCLALLETPRRRASLDVGTGTGAIALAIAHELPDAHRDRDRHLRRRARARPRERARQRARRRRSSRATCSPAVDGPFDLVVSNPPYVLAAELDALEPEVRDWEPRGALVDEGQTDASGRRGARRLDGGSCSRCTPSTPRGSRARSTALGYDGAHDQRSTSPGASESWRRRWRPTPTG